MNIIYYTKEFSKEIKENVNVILSPEFYWIKKIDQNNISIKEANKIAKNIFNLPKDMYSFFALKINNIFFAFAIDKSLKLNIPNKYINNIYLAQQVFFNYECIKIDNQTLKKINEIIFIIDEKCENTIDIQKITLPKKSINFLKNEIGKDLVLLVVFIFIAFNIYLIPNIYKTKQSLETINNKKFKLLKQNNLPTTTYQLQAIYNDIIDEVRNQDKIKKDLSFISDTPIKKFLKLKFENGIYSIEIDTKENLNNYFKQRFNILNYSLKPHYKVELQ